MRSALPWSLVLIVAACGGGGARNSGPPAGPSAPVPAPPTGSGELAAPAPAGPPATERRVVTDTYHGVTVEDPYRWLEADDAAVQAWSDAQDHHARAILDHLPGVQVLAEELTAIYAAPITRYLTLTPAGRVLYALRKQPDKQQAELVVMDRPEDAAAARLVLDPTAGGDATAAIDWFVPSPDGTKIAISVSTGGSEAGTLHVLDASGKELEPPIADVQRGTGGGDAAWTPDGKGLYYTRYPAPGEKPEQERDFWMQVWFHRLGSPIADDRYEMGKDLPRIAEIQLASGAGGRVLASVQNGDGGTFRHYVREKKGWRQLTDWDDKVVSMSFGPGGELWLVSHQDAPRGKVLRLAPGARLAAAKVVVPEGADAIVTSFSGDVGVVATKDRLYVTYQLGGPDTLRAFSFAGKPAAALPLAPVSSTSLVDRPLGGDLLVWSESYVVPGAWYRYAPKTNALTALDALSPKPPVSLEGWEAVREMATSKDGTQVPLNIIWKRGAPRDGSVPCLVTGYGGYAISLAPGFAGRVHPLLSRGLCFVVVNLRGGAEFGEAWHRAGALTRKQNVFDDFAAALDHLAAQRYTSPSRTAIIGGSNGGLLMGALLTQHPDKVKAVVAQVGIYDMLRVELTANGAYNVPEFGTVQDKDQFAALYAYSPYHHVVAGTAYPAVLMTTGANDPRVAPWHSRKMVAALQAAQRGDAPILLRTSASSGHGAGTSMSERIAAGAHVDAFVLWQLGVTVAPVASR